MKELEMIIGDISAEFSRCLTYTNGETSLKKRKPNKQKTEMGTKIVSIVERLIEENRLKRHINDEK